MRVSRWLIEIEKGEAIGSYGADVARVRARTGWRAAASPKSSARYGSPSRSRAAGGTVVQISPPASFRRNRIPAASTNWEAIAASVSSSRPSAS